MTRPLLTRFAVGAVIVGVLAGAWATAAATPQLVSHAVRSVVAFAVAGCALAVGTSLLHTIDTAGARFRMWRWAWRPPTGVEAGDDQDGDGRCSISGDIASAFTPGFSVYRIRSARGALLYGGVTGRDRPRAVAERLLEHFRDKRWAAEVGGAHAVEWTSYRTYQEAHQAERDLIRTQVPIHNKVRYTMRGKAQ